MTTKRKPRPVVLCVLDGWGYRPERKDNAIALAATPHFDRMMADCPHGFLAASGTDVGLPAGQMGNSEVGHLNLGAGRIVDQDIRRIDAAIEDGSLARNPTLGAFIERLRASGGTCHLMGLLSPGGVHSHQDQIAALAQVLDAAGVPVAVHAFLDGRDTPPTAGAGHVAAFRDAIAERPAVRLASLCGRYFAMDRDKRWDRVQKAYELLVAGAGRRADDPVAAIEASYGDGVTDEFFLPTALGEWRGMADGDGVLMANFRADRAREILTALLDPGFEGFARSRTVAFAAAAGMVEYSVPLNRFMAALFPPLALAHIFPEVVAEAGLSQLRIAETEKYAHVTFFFNGGVETPFPGEARILVPSPKVATYDLKPEMSAPEVTDRLVAAIEGGRFDFILVNYANPDMVGHTGKLDAAIAAIAAVDRCLGRLAAAVGAAGGALLVTADHGNAETMTDPETGAPFTAHTLNPVPVVLVGGPADIRTLADGRLADVAPTLLALLGLAQPAEMTGRSLIEASSPRQAAAHAQVPA